MKRALETAAEAFGTAAAACIAAMMLLTVADVALRGVLGRPIHGTFELIELLLAGGFFLALPAVFLRQGNIVVDIVDHHAPRAVPLLRRVASAIAVLLLAVMAWQGARAARDSWEFGDVTMDLSLPRIYYWLPVLGGLVCSAVAAALVLARGGERR